ncbi:MAG: sialidase family protein [Thermoproteota archaeon]
MQRLFLEDHRESYRKYWGEAVKTFTDHSFIRVSKDLRDWRWQKVKYEEGADFSEDDWAREGYVNVNEAYAGCNIEVLENGDIMFPVAANVVKCCRILGIDVNVVFLSCPQIMHGLIVFRGSWNKMEEKYDLTPSKPVVISDLKSSRGVDEPTIIVLKSRRIVVVFRGSNVISKNWKTRIRRGTPSHKWYVFSDDGGRTFSEPVPWHYDNGEIFYSPASISRFFRSTKNGKAYWFGNITGPEAYGNSPRYTLIMAEVDEETGFLKKETYTLVDDRNPETESEELQLSNFSLLEDRETKSIELYLTKLEAYREDRWRGDAYRYTIEVD